MLYLVVNNDFHVDNLLNQMHNFNDYDICVIRVPYNLNSDCKCLSDYVITINTPYKSLKEFVNPFKFKQAKKAVKAIDFTAEDVVVFLTDYDPMNQYIVYSAKSCGSRTILLEEGVATYYNNIDSSHEQLCIKDFIKKLYINYILGFNFVIFCKKGSFLFLQLKDKYIDHLILYKDIKLKRNINISVVDSCSEVYKDLDKTKCLFLNQPIYQSYLTEKEYFQVLLTIIDALSLQFDKVLFKFHPRDSKLIKARVKQIIENKENVIIVQELLNISETVKIYQPYFAISFFSDALFKLSQSGLEVIFLFHFFPKLTEHPVLISLSKVLNKMNYQFPKQMLNLTKEPNVTQNTHSKTLKQVLKVKFK